jgi:hypothetical protein
VTSETLLLIGAAGVVTFIVVLLLEDAHRPGYSPVYHTGSELELGERGWIQRANFLQVGTAVFAFAAGVHGALGSVGGAVLLAVAGFALIVAGLFAPDPARGYPPGTPPETAIASTWQNQVHYAAGPLAFLALLGACLTLAGGLQGAWRAYTVLTAFVGLAFMAWTIRAFHSDAANTGLVQRGLIAVYFAWIVLLSIHLVGTPLQG